MNSGDWKSLSQILGVELEEEQAKSGHVEECRHSVKVLYVKSPSPCVKDDILIFFILSM